MIRVMGKCGIDFVRDVDFVGWERGLVWDRACFWPFPVVGTRLTDRPFVDCARAADDGQVKVRITAAASIVWIFARGL